MDRPNILTNTDPVSPTSKSKGEFCVARVNDDEFETTQETAKSEQLE